MSTKRTYTKPSNRANASKICNEDTKKPREAGEDRVRPPKEMKGFILGNKYKFVNNVGSGGYAYVYKAREIHTDKPVAIKVIDIDNLRRKKKASKLLQHVRTEVATMKLLDHPHIVTLYDEHDENNRIFLVMEFMQGDTLRSCIKSNDGLDENRARYFFRQLVAAVNYCHLNGIYHRDLKPSNLLLDADKRVLKLTDFGLACMDGQERDPHRKRFFHTFCGTAKFCAPENLVAPEGGYDAAKCDVWSCGVILFNMLTNRNLLPEDDCEKTDKMMNKVRCAKLQQKNFNFGNISSSAEDLLSRVLQPVPQERCSLDDIINHPWFNTFSVEYPFSFTSAAWSSKPNFRFTTKVKLDKILIMLLGFIEVSGFEVKRDSISVQVVLRSSSGGIAATLEVYLVSSTLSVFRISASEGKEQEFVAFVAKSLMPSLEAHALRFMQ